MEVYSRSRCLNIVRYSIISRYAVSSSYKTK
nr:MAG TPA_asm: hypothetical protein [Caudoviricetes sp.]